jgi:SAM-dependent methyltransferase
MRPSILMRPIKLVRFLADFLNYSRDALGTSARRPSLMKTRPMLDDATKTTGFDTHYVYHTSWAARILSETRPENHVDISSAIWFVGIASAICPIDHYDYRPPELALSNVRTAHADLLKLPFADSALKSLSCMHVVEHVGLGRYGDPIDPLGDKKAMAELARVVAPGGLLLFVTPVGKPEVVFNAHRIYGYDEITSTFSDFDVTEFSLITDKKNGAEFIRNAEPSLVDRQRYGCGCWAFRKKFTN